MAYATAEDVKSRMIRNLSTDEEAILPSLLDDASIMINSLKTNVDDEVKKVVVCRMVVRALGDGQSDIPMGAMQGSMSGLGYSQSWTMGSGGSAGELYIGKTEKMMLKCGNAIGSYSPTEDMA